MDWWRKLRKNPLARLGAIILIIFYVTVVFADFVAPYNPYDSQTDGSLLPPTTIHWGSSEGKWLGAYVYPTTQGPTDLETGDRLLSVNSQEPSPIRFFVKGSTYDLFKITLPWFLITSNPSQINVLFLFKIPLPFSLEYAELTIFPGIPVDRHLFGTIGSGTINLLGTDEQGRDEFSRLLFGGRISLFIGLVGISISFPLGMLVGGISGYFGGWIDGILMRLVEVLMTIPLIYLLISLAAVLPSDLTSTQS